jgi:polysaccharide biosynthesis protein PslH
VKILIITPRIPYPPYRGDKLKIFNISKILSKKNSITILTFYENKNDLSNTNFLEKFGIETIALKLSLFDSLRNLISNVFSSLPFQVAYFSSTLMEKRIAKLTAIEKYDVVYFHLIRSAQYLECVQGSKTLKVLDFTDAVSLYLQRFAEVTKNPLKKLGIKIELKRILNYEPIASKFNTLFVCSEKDKDFLEQKELHGNIQLLKNGVDSIYFQKENIPVEKHRIIFTGNMPYFPNQDAVEHFVENILPSVIKKYADTKFYIVGQKPSKKVQSYANESIIVTGFVQDIKKEYLLSEVNVVPIRFGAGTLNKVIEALALGVPTVATSLSVAGLPNELKKYIYLADSPNEFLESISQIFEDENIRENKMKEVQKIVMNMLSWDKIVGEFESYLLSRIGK